MRSVQGLIVVIYQQSPLSGVSSIRGKTSSRSLLTIFLILLFAFSSYASDYNYLNKRVCKELNVPEYQTPKIEIVKKEDWIYPSVATYFSGTDTIYILEGNLKDEIIIHELAHANITKYFTGKEVNQKIQEILAGYVVYKLTKGRI